VGNVGGYLKPYDECDTFMSADAGVSWKMIRSGAYKYEVGDQGSLLVLVNDEEATDVVEYSTDYGKTWYLGLRSSVLVVQLISCK